MAEAQDFDRDKARKDAESAFSETAAKRATVMRDGVIGGVHLVRDVAADTVRSAGEVGVVAVGAARDLLVGVADGLRDVIGHAVPWTRRGGGDKQPPEPPKA